MFPVLDQFLCSLDLQLLYLVFIYHLRLWLYALYSLSLDKLMIIC